MRKILRRFKKKKDQPKSLVEQISQDIIPEVLKTPEENKSKDKWTLEGWIFS